ncbi:uncharacterized protein K02A2.6-like [Coccinella septempunctata]|uniref:uncharacterized protein K02A2.6-like n=1 Tax=Coccinella septempunctata TaxID=41139 RepID=UPI001D070754|nr:uncharacterized protein K02A2.6-like [Coccinella septempunctata]
MAYNLPPPEKLNLEGDNSSVAVRWESWKRSLLIYFEAADITNASKKRAMLLVLGGTALQDIFYNLPGASGEPGDDTDVFELAIRKLDGYFLPKQNKTYERHIFSQIKQEEGQSFEKFVFKLREPANKCKFHDPEEYIIDQIIRKCSSSELRKKILTMGDEVTLDKAITIANTLEIVNHQLESYEKNGKVQSSEINAIKMRNTNIYKYAGNELKQNSSEERMTKCSRCGTFAHVNKGLPCPAKQRKCNGCGKLGHYQKCCRTKPYDRKRKIGKQEDQKNDYKKHRKDEEEVQYIFNLNDDATIKCEMGGVCLKMLIDSGCKSNLISDETWEYLKENNVNCSNQIKEPKKIFLAYGSTTPLKVKGSFETSIKVNGKITHRTVYVISDGSRNLLGQDTALQLGVLKLGDMEVDSVKELKTPFPKFKNIIVEIPTDPSVKPVMQPYRRIPIPLEEKIHEKIEELLEMDIIEEVNEPSKWVSLLCLFLKTMVKYECVLI